MKASLVSFVIFMSAIANAGGSGEGSVNSAIFYCDQLMPVQEGEAFASLHIAENQLKMAFSNHVNDFSVSFEPVKVISRIVETAELKVHDRLIVIESLKKNLSITLDPVELLASTGTVTGHLEVKGQTMQGRCSVNLNNLRLILK